MTNDALQLLHSHIRHQHSVMPPPLEYERTTNFEDSRTGGVTSVAFNPSGNYLASGVLDRRVCIWEVDNGKLIHNFVTSSTVLSVAWVPGRNSMLLCGCQDGSINVLTTPSQVSSSILLVLVTLTDCHYLSLFYKDPPSLVLIHSQWSILP